MIQDTQETTLQVKLKRLQSEVIKYESNLGIILKDIVKKTEESKLISKEVESLNSELNTVKQRVAQLISHENGLLQSFETRNKDLEIKEKNLEEKRIFTQKMLGEREEEIVKAEARYENSLKFLKDKEIELDKREKMLDSRDRDLKQEKVLINEISDNVAKDKIDFDDKERAISIKSNKAKKLLQELEAREYRISTAGKKLQSDLKVLEDNKSSLEDKQIGLDLREASLNKRERRMENIIETNRLKGI